MKAPQLISTVIAFVIGAGAMMAYSVFTGPEKDASEENKELMKKLADAETRIEQLEARKTEPRKAAPASGKSDDEPLRAAIKPAEETENKLDEDASPEERIAQLLNSKEARSLMKGFAGAMSSRADQFIGREIDKYREQFDLTDAQADSIKKRMAAMMKKNTEEFQNQLDDEDKSFQDIMMSQGDFWRENEGEIETMLSEELNEDQFGQFKQMQLTEKTKRVQRSADYELKQMDEALDLDPAQEDQVFTILVQESPDYDPSMAIEGVETEVEPNAVAGEVSKEDAIRSVLTPEQTSTYNEKMESGGFGWRRRGPWGGGGR